MAGLAQGCGCDGGRWDQPPDQAGLRVHYSRGAYAARSLGGLIDQVGLLRQECATQRNVRQAYRHYRMNPQSDGAKNFRDFHCHENAEIEMLGVWDTVRALGFRAPLLWRFSPVEHEFHNHSLGDSIRHGFHALALDETRKIFEPVLWECRDDFTGVIEQVWFRGSHSDIGGHLTGYEVARPLANIPLTWLLDNAQNCGLPLPDGWKTRYPRNADAPSAGSWRGFGLLFLQRRPRVVCTDPSERIHESVPPGHRRSFWQRLTGGKLLPQLRSKL